MWATCCFVILLKGMKIRAVALFLIIVLSNILSSFAQDQVVRVAAASDLRFAMDSIVTLFQRTSASRVMVTYGSSGKLYEQVSNGAPFDMFFSADQSYPEMLWKNGVASESPVRYGKGRIVLWSKVVIPGKFDMDILLDPRIRRIAMANPQHAPYGRCAEETLRYFGLYDRVKGKLVIGENISQASQYVYTGAAEAGILALSLALSPPMKQMKGRYFVLPEESHTPLHQAYVVLKKAWGNKGAAAFRSYIDNKEAREVLRYFGFSVSP